MSAIHPMWIAGFEEGRKAERAAVEQYAERMRERADWWEEKFQKQCAEADRAVSERMQADYLLRRISSWDHMDTAADGAYWRGEIEKVLSNKAGDALTVAQPTAQFAVWEVRGNDDMDFVAQVDGPRETALAEARHYASQVVFDGGTAVIEEVTRREVERLSPVTERRPTRICPQDQHKCVGHRCVDKCFFNPDICTSNLPSADEQLTVLRGEEKP